MNTLYIDTRDNKRIVVRLKTGDEKFEEESVAHELRAQAALPLVARVLKKASAKGGSASGRKSSKIDEIKVERGPGSFTGLRVGIAIANTLAFSLQVRINGKRLGEIETPKY